jgi:polysaccharide chain length determinant protein (PEP-CTERM system associated)
MELREAENAREAIRKQMAGEEPVLLDLVPPKSGPVAGPGAVDIPVPTRADPVLESRIESLRKEIDTLLLKYTEAHPDVIAGKRLLAQLETQKENELALLRERAERARKAAEEAAAKAAAAAAASASASGAPRNPLSNNPVYQQLKVSLAEAEANVASLKARVDSYEAAYNALRAKAGSVPAIEAEFAQLNRDYEVHRQNYQSLLQRRESASLSGEMESASKLVDFRVVDPPRVSPNPVWPNRIMLVSLVFLAALGLGVGLAFLLSQIRPTFLDTATLRQLANRPLLGSVSMIWNAEQRRRARIGVGMFAVSCFALVGFYGGGLAYFLLHSRGL